jgi:hypothetical protein
LGIAGGDATKLEEKVHTPNGGDDIGVRWFSMFQPGESIPPLGITPLLIILMIDSLKPMFVEEAAHNGSFHQCLIVGTFSHQVVEILHRERRVLFRGVERKPSSLLGLLSPLS